MPFKRTHTMFSGDAIINCREVYLSDARVEIVGPVQFNDDDDDRWTVQLADGRKFHADGDDLTPHPEAEQLNTEFVAQIMEGHTALTQAFVIQAIEAYAKMVLKAPAKDPKDDHGFVSDAAWRGSAQFILGQYVAKDYARKERDKQFA